MLRGYLYEAANVLLSRGKMVSAQSLGRSACEAKRAAQSQGCGCPKLAVILHRMWVDGTDFKWSSKEAADQPASQDNRNPAEPSAGTNVPAGTLALVRSPLALRCSKKQARFTH